MQINDFEEAKEKVSSEAGKEMSLVKKIYPTSLSSLVVVVVMAGVAAIRAEYPEPEGWQRSNMTVSEKAYYKQRISHVCHQWRETARSHRLKEPYNVYLVVDPNKAAIWLEQDGRVLEHNYADIPKNMQWVLHHVDQETRRKLSQKIRLKLRVPYRRRRALPEAVRLLGRSQGGDFLSVYLSAAGCNIEYLKIPPDIKPLGRQTQDREFTESFVVSDAEYEQYRNSLADEPATLEDGDVVLVAEPNVSEWLKAEKQIYWEIERQTAQQDYVLTHLRIKLYDDRATARGEIATHYRSGRILPSQLRGRNMFPDPLLKIDHVGGSIWYVQGIEKTSKSWSKNLDLEFIVSAKGRIARSKYKKLLSEVRRKHSAVRKPRKEWTVALANGVRLELAGVCDYPSPGKKWWGPDGTSLGYEPIYFLNEHDDRWNDLPEEYKLGDELRMEVAFAISWPNGMSDDRVLEIPLGGGNRFSRSGSLAEEEVLVRPYSCERGRQSFDATVRISVDEVTFETITFKNISLVRGADMGFVIEVEK